MKPVLIIQTGHAPDSIRGRHGDFPHWFRVSSRLSPQQLRVVDVAAGECLPRPCEVAGAMITGSAAMVTELAAWSERTAGWIRDAMDVDLPLFGVCYGHQLMAHALGGHVGYLHGGREIGTQPIKLTAHAIHDPLAGNLPACFRAHTTHEQSVLEAPHGCAVLAGSQRDPHQLLRYGPQALSTQFHPEFNADVMRAYIKRKQTDLHREGTDPKSVFSAVAATPMARRILQQFARQHGWLRSALHLA